MDPRTPVIVGVGQVNQHDVETAAIRSPIGLFVDAARIAGDEAAGLLIAVDTVGIVMIGSWGYPDPGALAARELGISPRDTIVTAVGGNSPQLLVNEMAAAIQRGERDVVLVGGGEALRSKRRARKHGAPIEFESTDDAPCRSVIGSDRAGTNDVENAHGAYAPTQVFPLFETDLRGAAGRNVAEHQAYVGALWSHFADVAADNPHAWAPHRVTADEIVTPSSANRIINFPYTKLMNANLDVDQGAALLLTSHERAVAAGIDPSQLVYLHAGADAHDHWWVSERKSLAESVAIGVIARATLGASGLGVDDIARFDLYSCFPSAVQLAMQSIGLVGPMGGDPRPLTVTGGLGFGGGPLNNYPTHGIARMVESLRADPGSFGLTTALGWYATKHSCAVWSTTPPTGGFVRVEPESTQAAVDASPRRDWADEFDGTAAIEATAVPHDRDGNPTLGIVTALADDGRRVWANVHGADALIDMIEHGWEGRRATIRRAGTTNVVDEIDR